DIEDVLVWRDMSGTFRLFLVAYAWGSLILHADVVGWYHVVWFPHCIPRHAIHMSLVIKKKLKTHDRLRQWDVGHSINLNLLRCPLCGVVPDSHSHLFFECYFSSKVWIQVCGRLGMGAIPPRLEDVFSFLLLICKGVGFNVISRLLLGATSCYLWNERNSRLFKKKSSTVPQIVEVIISTVRLKLVTFKFKKVSPRYRLLLDKQ
ncbi:reverse transcriptase domain, reverse transcriptase zinc-binding domain protein, partial [Tanacetum coccineum]